MSDGRVEIKVNVQDGEVKGLTDSLGKVEDKAKAVGNAFDGAFQDKNGRWREANGRYMSMGRQAEMLGQKIESVGASSERAGFSVKNMVMSFGLLEIGRKAIGLVANSFGDLMGEMNESMKAWSTFEGNMAMIGKSSDEIAKVQASLQEFATQTIYSASDMASTYAQMSSIGYEGVEKLVKGMGGLAAASDDPQQAMKTMSQQMVQALAKPTLQWQDFQFMLDRTPAGMAQVAKHMGYSMDEFVSAVKDGHISSKAFADAVAEVGTNENFSKMATTYKTADQAMDGLKETLSNKLLPVYEKWQEFQIKGIEGITDLVDSFDVDGLINGFTKALPNIQKVANNIGKFLTTGAQKATKFFRPMTDGFVNIGKDMLGFYGSFGDMFDKIADGDWEGGLKVYSDAFSKTFDNIVDNSKNIVTGMKDNLFKTIGATSWSDVGTKVGSVLSDGIDWGANLLDTGWNIASSIVDTVTGVDWGNALYSFTTNVAGFAKNAYSEVKANLDERFGDGKLGQSIIDQIFNPDSELRVTLDKIDTAVTEGLKGAIDGVSEAILGMSISDIDDNLETLFGKIGDIEFTGDFGQLVTDIETAISESFGDFSFNDLLPELSWGTWEDDINDLLSWISAKGEEVKAKYRENFNFEGEGGKFSSGSSRGSGTGSGTVAFGVGRSQGTKVESPLKDVDVSADTARIETAIQTMYDTIQTMTTEANTQMETNFSDSMNRLFQTAMQGMGRVNQAFTSGYQTGLVNARGFSDSLVMIFENIAVRLQQSGMNAGEGFALGLESTRGRIMSTARSIANEVVTTINKALDEHSPSRVLFKSGAFAGEGFALGLDSWIDRVSGISNNLAMASVPDLSKVNHKFSGVNGTISQIIQSANDTNNAVVVEAIESLEETLTQKQFAITSDEVADKTQNRLDKTIGKNAKYNEAWGVGG